MPFIYSRVASLKDHEKVGSTQCVALVEFYAGAPHHHGWKQGRAVLGNKSIVPGTAIATFVNGLYPSNTTGNHAALFLRHGSNGFWVVDQWKDKSGELPRNISERFIPSRNLKQQKNGTWPNASNNADAYSIIEMR